VDEKIPPLAGDSLRQKILEALNGLLVLQVTTVVGEATFSSANRSNSLCAVQLTGTNLKIANTVVNTALGDATTIYTPDFFADPALMAAHQDAVKVAHDVREETIGMLKTVLEDFQDLLFPKAGAGAA
jgi:hypothetical protein